MTCCRQQGLRVARQTGAAARHSWRTHSHCQLCALEPATARHDRQCIRWHDGPHLGSFSELQQPCRLWYEPVMLIELCV